MDATFASGPDAAGFPSFVGRLHKRKLPCVSLEAFPPDLSVAQTWPEMQVELSAMGKSKCGCQAQIHARGMHDQVLAASYSV